jgi:hypothetical protein
MKWVVIGLNLLLLSWLMFNFSRRSENLKAVYWSALLFKLIAAIALGLIYTHYYMVGDTLIYFRDASVLAEHFYEDTSGYFSFLVNHYEREEVLAKLIFKEPRALLMVKIVSIFCLISFSNYWIVALYFAFVSFLGAWYLTRKIQRYFPTLLPVAAAVFLFFPSVVFWSSGIIKETLAMASIFFLSGIFLTIWYGDKIKIVEWLLIFVAAWLAWSLKYYFAAVFFAVTINTILFKFVAKLVKPMRFLTETILWLLLFIIPLVVVTQLHPNFALRKLFGVVVDNYNDFISFSSPEDVVQFSNLTPDFRGVLSNSPWALTSGLFRPFIWEANTFFQTVVAIENTVLLIGMMYASVVVRKFVTARHRMLIFSCCVYIIFLCIFITLSTPNFGTLSRYRVAYIPYFAFLLLCIPDVSNFFQRSFNRLVRK